LEYEENESIEDNDFMSDAREKFLYAVEYERDNREMALEDIKFGLLGEQWDSKDVEERKRSGRPTLTINKFPAHIRQVVNDARQNKPSIRVRPVDDNADVQTAEVINGLIRNIEVSSNADIAYDTAIGQAVAGGYPGYIRVNVDFAYDDTFDRDVTIDRVYNQFSVYGDPYATSADGSDWNCCFVVDRITKDEFRDRFKDAEMVDFEIEESQEYDWINDDGVWIAEYWHREEVPKTICMLSDGDIVDEDVYEEKAEMYQAVGIQKVDSRITKTHKVTQYIISGKEVLETNEWAGRYIPIVPVYGEEVVIENKRVFKSLIRDSKDPQKMLNFWRSTSTEVVSLQSKSPYIAEEGSLIDPQKWATANVKNYSSLEYKKGANPPQRQPFAGVPAGALQEAMNSSDDIKATMGMFGASIGEQDNAVSGRAIMARQRESDTGTFHFIDNLSRSLRHVGKIIVDLIPHVYQPGRIIRILGEDLKESENAQVGQPQPGMDLTNVYDLSAGKYDVVVESGPSFGTKRQEAANQMIEFARVNPAAAGLISDLIAKNLDWPGADEIAERFKAMLPPQVAGENPQIQALQQQLQQMQQQSQQMMGQLQNELQQLKQDKTIDMRKVEIDAYGAETDRLKVTQAGMTPEQVQIMVAQTVMQLMQSPDVLPMQQQQQPMQQPQPEGAIQ